MDQVACRVCDIILDESNRYKRSGKYKNGKDKGYDLICKSCKIRSVLANHNKKKSFKLNMRRGNQTYIAYFDSIQEKKSCIFQRKSQMRFGKCHNDSSSFIGKSVDEFVQYMDQDTSTFRQYFMTARCGQCRGIIRYDKRGYKVCESCGLFYSYQHNPVIEFIDIETRNIQKTKEIQDHLPRYDYTMYDDHEEPDEIQSTYDPYYSRTYRKRLN